MKKLEKIEIMTGTIEVLTGLHIGSGNTEMHIGGTDNPVIKTMNNEPYIPGSSLKGKIRSLLEQYVSNFNDNEIISALFGIKAEASKKLSAENIGTTRLSFWDCALNPEWKKSVEDNNMLLTEVKMENTIDREKGTALNPRNTERVHAGAKFDFKLSLKEFEGDNFLSIILGGFKLLEMDSLGGSGSRGYGKIVFKDLKIGDKDIQSMLDVIKPFEGERFL